ncbi:MAG: condensation domain-containing protein [Acidobacteria bacterium]|nr:condensation domain-containing protein [Acidobacteriota bacterium]
MLDDQKKQNATLNPDTFLKQREYWLKQLSGEQTGRSFPVIFNNRGKTPGVFEMLTFSIPDELFPTLIKISKGSNPKLFIIMLSALVVLLGKYTGCTDIMIGAPIYKQNEEGDFINTILPLKNQLSGSITFKQLLIEVRENFLQAMENRNYPIKNLLNDLELPFYQQGLPLFETAILMKNLHDKKYLHPFHPNIIFSFTRSDLDIKAELEYDPIQYDQGMMERLITHFNCFLAKALTDLDVPISRLDILPEQEKKQLIVDFNNTGFSYPAGKTLQELFAYQVEKDPNQIALFCEGKELTYKELNHKAMGYHCRYYDRIFTRNGGGNPIDIKSRCGISSHRYPLSSTENSLHAGRQ